MNVMVYRKEADLHALGNSFEVKAVDTLTLYDGEEGQTMKANDYHDWIDPLGNTTVRELIVNLHNVVGVLIEKKRE